MYILSEKEAKSNEDIKDGSRDISTISDPIERYMTECLKQVSYDAIIEAGEHGGFTSLKEKDLKFDLNNPTSSDGVVLGLKTKSSSYDEPFAIPYYWHMTSKDGCLNNCDFDLSYPYFFRDEGDINIEEELDNFIEKNIRICLNDFKSFKDMGYTIKEQNEPETTSSINKKTISFSLNFPIEIKKGNNEYNLKDYYFEHNIDLNKIFRTALKLSLYQARYRYLERQMINIISAYGSSESDIPPISESTFNFGDPGKIWVENNVENKVNSMLSRYIGLLRVVGSGNYVNISAEDELRRSLLNEQMRIDINESTDLDIHFTYLPIWNMYFDMNCDGGLCKPESFSSTMMLLLGTQRYRFFYTMSYPVMVKIHDDKAFDGEGYDFYFALESNFKNNEIIWQNSINGLDEPVFESAMYSDSDHWNSGIYEIKTRDSLTGKPIDNVTAYFTCGDNSCQVARTKDGKINTKLPICTGGFLTLVKKGYMDHSTFLATEFEKGEDLGTLFLEPIREKNITLNKIKFTKPTGLSEDEADTIWQKSGSGYLEENEEAVIMLTRKSYPGEKEHIVVASLNTTHKKESIKVAPGEYDVKVFMFDKSELIIPEDKRETGGLLSKDYTMPEMRFNKSSPWLLGGLDGEFEMTDQIDSSDIITLRVVSFEMNDVPENYRKIEDLQILGQVKNYTEIFENDLGFRYR